MKLFNKGGIKMNIPELHLAPRTINQLRPIIEQFVGIDQQWRTETGSPMDWQWQGSRCRTWIIPLGIGHWHCLDLKKAQMNAQWIGKDEKNKKRSVGNSGIDGRQNEEETEKSESKWRKGIIDWWQESAPFFVCFCLLPPILKKAASSRSCTKKFGA